MALEPGSVLDGWRGWDSPPVFRPAVVRQLGGGRSNRSFLLTTTFVNGDGQMVTIAMNSSDEPLDYDLNVQGEQARLHIPARAIQTLVY